MKQWIVYLVFSIMTTFSFGNVLVEAESFSSKGGWLIDQQFFENMGSPYLLAHGYGRPVENATTQVNFASSGTYHVYARTMDWVPPQGPGKFKVVVNGQKLNTLGQHDSREWMWHYAGSVSINSGNNTIALEDLTGFEGRVDAVWFSKTKEAPTNESEALMAWRKTQLGLPDKPIVQKSSKNNGVYDLVVIGGGTAGIGAAVSAARLGLSVALIQNRPVLGGNNSSEVRVHMLGKYQLGEFPILGEIMNEIRPKSEAIPPNADYPQKYRDDRKLSIVQRESNIDLFLNHHAFAVSMDANNPNKIAAVIAKNIKDNTERKFFGYQFVDCTGDGTIGFLAGAEYMYGREAKSEFNEPRAPAVRDLLLMGFSNQWHFMPAQGAEQNFPAVPWAHTIPSNSSYNYEKAKHGREGGNLLVGEWFWEGGMLRDKLVEAEYIRDNNFRAVYGYFNWLRTGSSNKSKYQTWKISWIAYVSGRRESRRLVGDVVLTENHIMSKHVFPDRSVPCTWSVDLHEPKVANFADFGKDAFLSDAFHHGAGGEDTRFTYHIPYRTFYSKNVENLYMAGRNISTTHVAMGKTRVMATTGMMGEVVGRAAHLSRLNLTTPRGVYEEHLVDLVSWFKKSAGYTGNYPTLPDSLLPVEQATSIKNKVDENKSAELGVFRSLNYVTVQYSIPAKATLSVYNVSGDKVVEEKISSDKSIYRISPNAFTKGVYLVEIRGKGFQVGKKLVF